MSIGGKGNFYFNDEGKFRILMVSDIQERGAYDPRTLQGLDALMETQKPDLVILGGDNVDGRYVKGYDRLKNYLDLFLSPMEKRNIPWIHIYGNHDYDCEVDMETQNKLYSSYKNCVSGKTEKGIPGYCNYVITIKDKKTGKDAFAVYALDTHHKSASYREGLTIDDILLENHSNTRRKWDFVRFEQLMWYWNTSKKLEKKNGAIVPGMAVTHVALPEFDYCLENPEQTKLEGCIDEVMQSSCLNSGMYATMLQRGDIKIICSGHIHKDTAKAEFGGISLCYDGSAGFSVGGKDESRGGRVFDINSDGSYTTYFVASKDLTELKKPGTSICGKDCKSCEKKAAGECKGCRSYAAPCKVPIFDGMCEIYRCASQKLIPDCTYCKDHPCEKFKNNG